jgi:hypothetical protein
VGVGFAEALGIRPLEEPGGGAPIAFGGFVQSIERDELALALSAEELAGEVVVSLGFAADGADVAANVAGGADESAAGGDEGADFAALGFIEGAGAAGGKRGARSRKRGVGCGEHGCGEV